MRSQQKKLAAYEALRICKRFFPWRVLVALIVLSMALFAQECKTEPASDGCNICTRCAGMTEGTAVCTAAYCGETEWPDAPSAVQPPQEHPGGVYSAQDLHIAPAPAAVSCGPKWLGGCWDYNHPNLSWKQAFLSKEYLIPHGIWAASIVLDDEATLHGDYSKCHEGNADLRAHPTGGELALYNLRTDALLMGFDLAIRKLNRRVTNLISFAPPIAGSVLHFRGATQWFEHCY